MNEDLDMTSLVLPFSFNPANLSSVVSLGFPRRQPWQFEITFPCSSSSPHQEKRATRVTVLSFLPAGRGKISFFFHAWEWLTTTYSHIQHFCMCFDLVIVWCFFVFILFGGFAVVLGFFFSFEKELKVGWIGKGRRSGRTHYKT